MSNYLKIKNESLNISYDFFNELSSNQYVSISKFLSIGEINQLYDINFSSLDNNHFLVYNSTSSQWENKQPSTVFSAIFSNNLDPSLNDLRLLKGVYNGVASSSTTEFLRHDGVWAEPSSSSIVGIIGDETTKELTISKDFSLVYTSDSSTFNTKLKSEVATANREITFPDELNGEVSLTPIYNTYYSKDFSQTDPVTFTKNNECIWLIGGSTNINQDAENDSLEIFVEIPDATNLTNHKSLGQTTLGSFSTRRGTRFKLCRHKSANIFIAPANADHNLEILGSGNRESGTNRKVLPQNMEIGKVYRIASVTSASPFTSMGSPNNNIGTFFRVTQSAQSNYSGGPYAYECINIKPQDLKFGLIDIVGYQMGNAASPYCYTISTPSQVFNSPTFSGSVSFTGEPVFSGNTSFESNIIAKSGINLREPSANGTNYVKLTSPAIDSSNSYTLTFPNTSSTADNQVMKADQNGNFQWVTIQDDSSLGVQNANSNIDIPTQKSVKSYIENYVDSTFKQYLDDSINNTVYEINDYVQGSGRPEVELSSDAFGKETVVTINLNSNPDDWLPVIYLPSVSSGASAVNLGQTLDILIINDSQSQTEMAHSHPTYFYQQNFGLASAKSDNKIFTFYNHMQTLRSGKYITGQIFNSAKQINGTNNQFFNFSSTTRPAIVNGPGYQLGLYGNLISKADLYGNMVKQDLTIDDLQAGGYLPQNLSNATLNTPLFDPAYSLKIANDSNVKVARNSRGQLVSKINRPSLNVGNLKYFRVDAGTTVRIRVTLQEQRNYRTHNKRTPTINDFVNLTTSNTNNIGSNGKPFEALTRQTPVYHYYWSTRVV